MIDGRANNRPKDQKTSEPNLEVKTADAPGKDVSADARASQKQVARGKDREQSVAPPGKRKRRSVLKRLREKQAEIAARSGLPAPEQEKEDMERNRK